MQDAFQMDSKDDQKKKKKAVLRAEERKKEQGAGEGNKIKISGINEEYQRRKKDKPNSVTTSHVKLLAPTGTVGITDC